MNSRDTRRSSSTDSSYRYRSESRYSSNSDYDRLRGSDAQDYRSASDSRYRTSRQTIDARGSRLYDYEHYEPSRTSSRAEAYSSNRTSSRSSDSTTRSTRSDRGNQPRERVSARTYSAPSGYEDTQDGSRRRTASYDRGSSRAGSRTSSRTSSRSSRGYNAATPNGRGAADGMGGPSSALQQATGALSGNVWVARIAVVVVALILIFVLFNLVTCIGGALAPKTEGQGETTQTENAENSQSAESASGGAMEVTINEGVESPWTENGRFSTGDSDLDKYIKAVCDEHTSEGATFDQAAYDTNIYITRTSYVERENNQSPWGPTWDVEYAKQFFDEGEKGNCYNFAAVTEYVLKYFGYSDAEAEPCIVKLESGAWGDHGLVFVTNKVDGKRCIVDDALSANGWMLDIDAYDFDVRNIAQNSTIKGNVDALDDDDNPTPIPPGELTEEPTGAATVEETGEGAGAENGEEV